MISATSSRPPRSATGGGRPIRPCGLTSARNNSFRSSAAAHRILVLLFPELETLLVQRDAESVLGNLLLRFKNFFPSDVTRPQETMLQMEGTAGIEVRGADSYQSIVRYTMT